jgi:hypothetical protein
MFKKEVQDQFKKAGWFEGRNVMQTFDKVKGFDKLPLFLKEFLYEYGDLEVKTLTTFSEGIMDFKALTKGIYPIENYINKNRYYGNVFTFPIADYHLDSAALECDADGRVYLLGDFPCLPSNDFKTGIEKVIMEDFTDTLQWDSETKKWVDE